MALTDAREEWVKKQEVAKRVKKASHLATNTYSQQMCQACKKESKMQSSVRGLDGKIKVTKSTNSYAATDPYLRNSNP